MQSSSHLLVGCVGRLGAAARPGGPGSHSAAGTGCSWGNTRSKELGNSSASPHVALTQGCRQFRLGTSHWQLNFCRTHLQGRACRHLAHLAGMLLLAQRRPAGLSAGTSYRPMAHGIINGLQAKKLAQAEDKCLLSSHYHVCAWMKAKVYKPSWGH